MLRPWTLAVLFCTSAAADCVEGTCGDFLQVDLALGRHGQAIPEATASLHPWPHARGKVPGQFGTTDVVLPLPAGRAANWTWHNPMGQWEDMVAGGPVIDSERNLYLMTMQGLWKFSPSGETLWHYETPGRSDNEAYLSGDTLFGSTTTGYVFAVDRHTGHELWSKRVAERAGGDAAYPAALDGVFVFPSSKFPGSTEALPGGNMKIFGMATDTGNQLWEYDSDAVLWNLTPLFPDDDTFVYMTAEGNVVRLGLHNGTVIWKTELANTSGTFSDGGAVLGPNKVVYTCSNLGTGQAGEKGVVRAVGLEHGNQIWEHILSEPCCTFPAVGHVKGADSLAVVVTPGAFPGKLHEAGSVVALDAETGSMLWTFNALPYESLLADGDAERVAHVVTHGESPNLIRQICLPAHWSAPAITGDGTVYVGRMDGKLYAVHGKLTGDEVGELVEDPKTGVHAQIQWVGSAPVHGALGFADGLLGYATCDSLYVWLT